ncbi:MAG: hypothetical protein HC819_13810 [Cyclobacteriaceae bacterium]|nr:hypothetical protein [Cyclobacteriaceae bacterium]
MSSSTYIRLEKTNSNYETGLVFSNGANNYYYIYSDNYGNESLKIQASGLSGEDDNKPRIEIPKVNKNIYFVQSGGNVGIGINNPTEKLVVDGKILAEEVKVQVVPSSDYVFEPDYELKPLLEVDQFIQQNKHLPDIPSAAEFKENGVGLGEMDNMLLRKVEELTLYVIQLMKENEELKETVKALMAEK